ncbi:MAG: copper chaperone PCu(A)C [Alphaproteobacteria bacterium]|nr:copper chaperone PCu(A)C [Alphaproteobacteria bacterium]
MSMTRRIFLLVTAPALSAVALDRWPTSILDAWARATPPMARTGVVYMTIRNEGREPDALIAAQTEAAARAELHRTVIENGIARMQPVPHLEIPPGSDVRLEPNGLHLMLIELRAPLVAGTSFPLRVKFRSGLELALAVPVRTARAGGHSAH